MLLLLSLLLLAACGATADYPETTATPSPAATPDPRTPTQIASTPTPLKGSPSPTVVAATGAAGSTTGGTLMKAWAVPPTTGVANLDELIAAMTSGDTGTLAVHIERGLQTSSCEPPIFSDARPCAPGVPVGTPRRFISVGLGCHLYSMPVDGPSDIARLADTWTRPVTSLAYVTRSTTADRYRLVFLNVRDGSSEAGWMLALEGERLWFMELQSPGRICAADNLTEAITYLLSPSTLLVPPPP
ncbi:MAG: hypothetical protein AB7G21_06710 [Dehalococcoidia bacterium]